jgi:hypothetical protein
MRRFLTQNLVSWRSALSLSLCGQNHRIKRCGPALARTVARSVSLFISPSLCGQDRVVDAAVLGPALGEQQEHPPPRTLQNDYT